MHIIYSSFCRSLKILQNFMQKRNIAVSNQSDLDTPDIVINL